MKTKRITVRGPANVVHTIPDHIVDKIVAAKSEVERLERELRIALFEAAIAEQEEIIYKATTEITMLQDDIEDQKRWI